MDATKSPRLAAEDYIEALAAHGIEHLFVNPGTDFAPLIEAFSRAAQGNRLVPKPMVVPHEHAAVAMAHGCTLVTGKPQAVMLHVNVGTANAINALIDASRDRVPMLLTSGRTPYTEEGAHGSRSVYIHWAQEMFDQAGMLREFVKWDYEMRRGDQAWSTVARAMEIAQTSPTGPVYLSLPREVLGEEVADVPANTRPRRARPLPPRPAAPDVARLAEMIAGAKLPLIITGQVGRDPAEAVVLTRIAERFGLAVTPFNPRHFAISAHSPMFQGFGAGALLKEADLILVMESDVPWIPSKESPAPGAKVVQIGEDPMYQRYPMRSFPSDLSITTGTLALLEALESELAARLPDSAVVARKQYLTERSAKLHAGWQAEIEKAGTLAHNTLPWVNHCLRDIIAPDTLVVNEYSFRQEYCPLEHPGSLFSVGPAGGLGWGLPAALGLKLGAPDKFVLSLLGDGAYMFANPTACHFMASTQNLPTLSVIYNNGLYGAVRRATLDMYPKGAAAEADGRLLADLANPPFEEIICAHGGYGERVERPAALPAALARAAAATRAGQQALVNVISR